MSEDPPAGGGCIETAEHFHAKRADGGERDPLKDLLVSEITEDTQLAIAEALDGLIGVTRQEHLITLQEGLEDLNLQRKVVAYMLGRYARDILKHGHVIGTTNRMGADDLGAALGVHSADIDDAAMQNGDLRWYREGSQVELPHERVRHAAKMLTFARGEEDEAPEATATTAHEGETTTSEGATSSSFSTTSQADEAGDGGG